MAILYIAALRPCLIITLYSDFSCDHSYTKPFLNSFHAIRPISDPILLMRRAYDPSWVQVPGTLLVSNPRWFFHHRSSYYFCPAIFLFRVNSLELDSLNHTGHSTFWNNPERSGMASDATSLLRRRHSRYSTPKCHISLAFQFCFPYLI